MAENFASGRAGTLEASEFAFRGCVANVGEKWELCAVSEAAELSFKRGELVVGTGTADNLKISNGAIRLKVSGCGPTKTWTITFEEALLAPRGAEGEFRLNDSTEIPVQIAGASSGEGVINNFGLRMGSEGGPVTGAQESVEVGPFAGDHWYRGGAGIKRGERARQLLAAGAPFGVQGSANSLTLETTSSGIKFAITCSAAGKLTGSVENPVGGGPGAASLTPSFGKCAVSQPAGKGCLVKGGGFAMGTLAGIVANPLEPSPLFELAPSEKTSVLGSFEVGGCSQASLNKLYRIEGHLFAQPQLNASRPSGAWLIPASSNSISVGNIRVGGQLAAASGELVAETTEGAIEIISMG